MLFSTVIIIYWVKRRKTFTTRVNTIKTNGTRQPAQRRSHSLDISAFVTVVMCLRFCKLRMRDVDQFMDSAHVMYVTSTEVDGYFFCFFFYHYIQWVKLSIAICFSFSTVAVSYIVYCWLDRCIPNRQVNESKARVL